MQGDILMVQLWTRERDGFHAQTARLGCIMGSRRTLNKAYFHHDVETWDHCPIYATIWEDEAQNYLLPMKKEK